MIDKSALLQAVIADIECRHKRMAEAAKAQADEVQQQEGPMKTRYDTMRTEGGWVADGLHMREEELKCDLNRARAFGFPVKVQRTVGEGSLVTITTPRARTVYFILPFSGGYETEVAGQEVVVITPRSPIAEELLGRGPKQTLCFRGSTLTIESVE